MNSTIKTITVSFGRPNDQKRKCSETMYKVPWGNGFVYIKKFVRPIFYGNGGYSEWQSKNLRLQIKLMESLNSGLQQSGYYYDSKLAKMIKRSIKSALDL